MLPSWRTLNQANDEKIVIPSGVSDRRIKSAIAYIQGNFDRKLSVRELAAHVAMSLKHFEFVFKRQTGLRPKEYLRQTRIIEAQRLLGDPDLNISEIAFSFGYQDLRHFERDFIRVTSCSPRNYRRTGLQC